MTRIAYILLLVLTMKPVIACSEDAESVIITIEGQLSRPERAALLEHNVLLGSFLGSGKYEAYIPSGADLPEVLDFIGSVEPLAPSDKLDAALRDGHIPENGRLADGKVRLHATLFDVSPERALTVLESVSESVYFNTNWGVWVIDVREEDIKALAALPEVRSIEPPPEPGTL